MKCLNNLLATLAFSLTSLLVIVPAHAAEITLQDSRWVLLTVPADASNTTIQSLFADDLPASGYGQSWALFRFDAAQQQYVQPAIGDTLAQGDGFWMIQTTGSSVTLDLPGNLPEGQANASLPCASASGCFSSKLPASTASGKRFSLLGAPYSTAVSINDIRLTSSEDSCSLGYDLAESAQEGYLTDTQWAYNSATEQYVSLSSIVEISPWQGFWVSTPQQQSPVALYMLLPNPNN